MDSAETKYSISDLPFKCVEDSAKNIYTGYLKDILTEGLSSLEMSLALKPLARKLEVDSSNISKSNILIIGKLGSGKTTFAKLLCLQISKCPYYVHVVRLECKQLKGKKPESLEKIIHQSLQECVHYQPSVLILDDIEVIVGQPSSHDASQENAYYSRIGSLLRDSIHEIQSSQNYVVVIATTASISKLNAVLISDRGQHFFTSILEIPDLTKIQRYEILKFIMENRKDSEEVSNLDLNSVANKTEGYVMQDFNDLVEKTFFAQHKRVAESPQLTHEELMIQQLDLNSALENCTPLALRNVELVKDVSRTWQDVGGLNSVKEILLEVLMWPSKYPDLFATCPIRHQTGILLYGAPGTGKTLLAGVVAQECGLNFISIKGPELLSKYIGASEEAVRNVFQKAQSAKPCILFFDEFDSLAPRRGHDSTGVTDRVVNQLLTQLDGVETLYGVWVLAATSRPDLLDPALLRPGRLDKAVLCPLPDEDDRFSILQALSRSLNLSSDVDLSEISRLSEGFTGADLQAILYTAQLSAVERMNDTSSDTKDLQKIQVNPTEKLGEILQNDLLKSLTSTRPSLSKEESYKYSKIYQKFSSSKSNVDEFSSMVSQRATLA